VKTHQNTLEKAEDTTRRFGRLPEIPVGVGRIRVSPLEVYAQSKYQGRPSAKKNATLIRSLRLLTLISSA
jgi:hypothetical protein